MLYVSISTRRSTSRNFGVSAQRTTLFEHAMHCRGRGKPDGAVLRANVTTVWLDVFTVLTVGHQAGGELRDFSVLSWAQSGLCWP